MRRTAVAALRYRKVLRFISRSPCDMERAGYRTSRRPDIGLMRGRGSLLCLGLATVAQPCGYPIDGQMDCLHHALVRSCRRMRARPDEWVASYVPGELIPCAFVWHDPG